MPHKTRRLVFAVALIVLSAAVGWALGSAPQPAAALAAASPGQDAQTAMDMAMPGSFFNPGPFMPHGGCYLWTQSLILLHTLSDGAIGVAYYCIPIILLYFVRRRQDLKFKWIFVLFAAFVMACGTTHLMEVWNIWHADYWLAGFVKAFTALVSVGTTLLLIKLMPVALALPSAEELRKAHAELEIRVMERTAELAQTNRSLVEEITERKRTEAGLIESERRYHDLFANMNEGLAHCRMIIEGDRPVDFVYLAVNDMFTTLTGLKDVVGKRITELIPGIRESDPDFFEIYGRVAMTGKPEKHEQYLKALSAWLALSVYSTEPSCFVVIFDVITKRKQAEIALRETNEYLDNLFKYANAPIIVWDPRFHITRFNHAFESLTGRTAAEVIGQSLEILFPPGLVESSMALIKQTTGGERWETVEISIRHRDGSVRTVLWNSATIFGADGKMPMATIAQGHDITERIQAEMALRQSEAVLREGQRLARLGNWEWNTATGQHTWSPEIYRIYGRDPELGPAGVPEVSQYFAPESWAGLNAAVEQALKHHSAYEYDAEVVRPDGTHCWITARGEAWHDASGKITGLRGTVQDITGRKLAEDKIKHTVADLERSNKELEHFAYVASHDLQEPLRMVSSYTQLLEHHYAGQLDDKARKYIHYAVDGAVRMQTLINDLLTYSRAGRRGKPMEPTDAHAVLGEALRNLAVTIGENHAVITNDDLPTVTADASQLALLFQNLLANAIKFRRAELPRIHVSARAHDGMWLFAVQDNGIGIEAQYAERVFVIFQRLHTREEYPGTGIGLAVCQRIVERHGGKIWFESRPGNGTTFFFTMPGNPVKTSIELSPASAL